MKLSGKRVLVTGADGFIGSHLTELLVQNGCQVRALSYYNSFNDWGWLNDLPCLNEIEVISGDIRDPHFCRSLLKDCEVVFHLAALIAIPYSYVAPSSYVETNVTGTLNMCQAALDLGVSKFLHTSTSEVYGTANYVPIDEKHPLQPQSPYSATKMGADLLALSFYNTFDLPVTVVRPFNTYGPRQSARAIIPSIITQIAAKQPSIKLGDLLPTRDLNFVKDTCQGFLQIAEADEVQGEIINVGSNFEISMGDLVQTIKSLMNSDMVIEADEQRIRPEKSEVHRLWCDNSKIKELTGFQPSYNLEQGLKETIEWFKDPDHLSKYKAGIYNV